MTAARVVRILGIDPGSRVTGYAVVDRRGPDLRAVACGAIRPPATLSFESRLLRVADDVGGLVDRYEPAAAAIEDLFHALNPRSVFQLAQVRGAVILEIVRRGVPLFTYAPRSVKAAVTGVGSAEKRQVRAMVERLLGIDLGSEPDDVSDAIAVAICHAHTRREDPA